MFHILGVALFCLLGACPVFVAGTGRKIRVRTQKQTVLINANFWPRVRDPRPYCTTITSGSVPFHSVSFLNVPGFPASPPILLTLSDDVKTVSLIDFHYLH